MMLGCGSSTVTARRLFSSSPVIARQIGSTDNKRLAVGTFVVAAGSGYIYYNHPHSFSASVRALRLFTTCCTIVADYKLSPLLEKDSEDDKSWEAVYLSRMKTFQAAQEAYTQTADATREQKQQAKLAMESAAEALAEAKAALSDRNTLTSQRHRRCADRILQLCQTNQGIYIKIGQHLANLDYLLPSEYIDCLQKLFNDNPITPFSTVRRVVEDELSTGGSKERCRLDDHFATFETTPIASASLAQVHAATLHDGTRVAVKVQHAALQHTATADVQQLLAVASVIEYLFPRQCPCSWLAEEIAPHIHQELNFVQEGRNAERASRDLTAVFGDSVAVPAIYWQYSTPRVLTMEYMDGVSVTEYRKKHSQQKGNGKVANLIARVLTYSMFHNNYAHCDPHPANVLLRSNERGLPQLVLLDHGLYRELSPDFQHNYARLWKSLLMVDLPGIYQACSALGVKSLDGLSGTSTKNNKANTEGTYRLLASVILARPLDTTPTRSTAASTKDSTTASEQKEKVILRGYAQLYLAQIVALLDHIPRPMLMMLKLMDCVRHLHALLDDSRTSSSTHDLLAITGRSAARAIVQKESNPWRRFLAWVDYFWHVEIRMWLARNVGSRLMARRMLTGDA